MLNSMVHAGNTGDVLAALPAMREFFRVTKIKPTLYLIKDHPAEYYAGATHPVTNDAGEFVSLNKDMIRMLIPLLLEQPYLADVQEMDISELEFAKDIAITKDEKRHLNLSFIRDTFCNIPYGDIRRWYFYPYPDLACDLSKKYIDIPIGKKDFSTGKVIITRTERYTNDQIDYSFLKDYEDDLLFAGTMKEYNNFCMNFDLNIRKLNIDNFLELAQALKQSNGLIANQTMIFQIAEGLKIPRAVELCADAPNVIPVGENAFDFYSTAALKVYFHKIHGTYAEYVDKLKNPATSAG
jgi:hypothetical protein